MSSLRTNITAALRDITKAIALPQLIFYMAWSDVRARYKRSVLGPLWITLGTAIGVIGLGFVWSALFKMDRATFVPLLTIGLILWQFIAGCIVEGTSLFCRQSAIIRNLDLPMSIYPAQLLLRHVINLAHNIPLFFLVALILGVPITTTSLLAIPALLLVIANLFWMTLFVGVIGARFRDFEYMIATIMPLLMFFSPVMYRPHALGTIAKFIWLNPLAYMIEIVRMPLLNEVPSAIVIGANVALLVIGSLITLAIFGAKRKRIALWV